MRPGLQGVVIHLLFFASGFSGLLWQVAWVRGFARVFGNTVASASVVAGVFVAALGVGALVGGRWADGDGRQPLRAFGLAELAIGALGLLGAGLLPWLGPASSVGGYAVDASGWLYPSPLARLAQGVLALGLVGLPALLMGATLSLLVRHRLGDDVALSGRRVGLLYGVNTLGAAAGALSADALLIPALGLFAAKLVAAAANVVVGLAALALGGRPLPGPAAAERRAIEPRVLIALFLGGFAALGLEILWLRFLGSALGAYRAVFATLLAVHLSGLWLGATALGPLGRTPARARLLLGGMQASIAVLALWPLLGWSPEDLARAQLALRPELASASAAGAQLPVLRMQLGMTAALVLPASVAMGAVFPLANQVVQRVGEVGRRAGGLYLATASGNLLGSLAVGLVLLPLFGIQHTALLLAGLAVAAALVLAVELGHLIAPAAAAVVATALVVGTPPDAILWSSFPAGRIDRSEVRALREGVEHTVLVTGRPEGPARLWTSGHPMTSTTPEAQRYMRLMAHLPLFQIERPRRALVICFGVGNTVHAASLHPLERLDVADLDRDVLAVAPHFRHANRDVLSDPRVRVIVDDGRHWLAQQQARGYDLITLEPPPIANAGVSSLYSVELYRLARAALRPGGAISQWLPAYQVPGSAVRSLVAAFVQVFPEATLHVGADRELVLVGWNGPVPELDLQVLEKRFARRASAAADLGVHGVADPRQLALTFAADARALARVARGATPVTDDRPTLEYAQVSHVMETRLPAGLMQPRRIERFCPGCARDPALREALSVAQHIYDAEAFARFSNLVAPRALAAIRGELDARERAVVARSSTLRWLLRYEPKLAAARRAP